MKCGLLGEHLGHSYSPLIHGYLGDYSYSLFEKQPEELEEFLKNGDFSGLNVTIPYKKTVMAYLDDLTPAAERMGCVNTIVRRPDGSLLGHNSDHFGFISLVRRSGIGVRGKKVLVLGSGGASNAAVKGLEDLGAFPVVISRSGENNYGNLCRHADAAVIVNTTPVGMYPNTGLSPIDLHAFPSLEGVLDVIYNPARTRLLLDAEALGLPAENGLWMLAAQAKESAEYFTGKKLDDGLIASVHGKLAARMQNIALIGMPGCGKSMVGALLAEKLGRRLIDLDSEIEKSAGMPIPEIFARDGEEAFRRFETEALETFGRESGLILATGGGCVTRLQNYPLLRQNSRIIWLRRDIDALPTQGRPLSKAGSLADMYEVRRPLYARFADLSIDNNGAPGSTADAIAAYLEGTE